MSRAQHEAMRVTGTALPKASELSLAVEAAFADGGELHRADASYRPRTAQIDMAIAVASTIEAREVLVVEAGTGVGKTFAYLVPALMAGRRTLVSTATKSLQDQLFLRDLPRLRDALALPFTAALLKGRASYLCLQRLTQARQSTIGNERMAQRTLAKIEDWSHRTLGGDLAEMEGLDERSPLIPLVTSTRENCLGTECGQYRACHVMKARRDAMAADLVVVNHHLFFADVALRETGVAELLPSVEVAVFDEAHQLIEAGVSFLGQTLGSAQVVDFARDLLALGLAHARGLQAWQELAGACDARARELRLVVAGERHDARGSSGAGRLRWEERASDAGFATALDGLAQACARAGEALETVSELAPEFTKLAERAMQLAELATAFAHEVPAGEVRWIDVATHGVRLVESPLDVRDAMREQIAAAPRAWIFTSATLGADDALGWFTAQAGLETARTLRIASPFDYAHHARLYVPVRFPKPSEPGHTPAVAALAAACARAAGGRTFVLTTTLRALAAIGDALEQTFASNGDAIAVLVQGAAPKRQLLQRFIDTPRAVLVGSQSFWEGIDVPGDALQCVLIDKLPFPPPNDPLVEARVKRIEQTGGNAFRDHFIAEAAVSMKQGAGRLIRRETDRGLLVVCDPRLVTMGYGRTLRNALPPMPLLATEVEALEWLAAIAGASGAA